MRVSPAAAGQNERQRPERAVKRSSPTRKKKLRTSRTTPFVQPEAKKPAGGKKKQRPGKTRTGRPQGKELVAQASCLH